MTDHQPTTPLPQYAPYPDPAHAEPAYTDPVYTDPVYTDPVYTDPVYTDPAYPNPAAQPMQPVHPAQQTPAYPAMQPNDGTAFAITSFVLGIVSITTGIFLAAIIGLIFGVVARKRPGSQHGLATWGIWLNAVALAFWVLAIIFMIFFFSIFIGAGLGLVNEVANGAPF